MQTKTYQLLAQVRHAQRLGARLLAASGLNQGGIIYAFATPTTFVINCRDYATAWECDERQIQLWQAIAQFSPTIQSLLIEKDGKGFYQF